MATILIITASIILAYLLYPVFLKTFPEFTYPTETDPEDLPPVSVVLLTYNGKEHLAGKLKFLAEELASRPGSELIVMDDCSTDGTGELLESLNRQYPFRLVRKDEHLGIPDSMNRSLFITRHEWLIFCDQRQTFTANFLREITAPLTSDEVGAVSCLISCHDNGNQLSFLRKHENFIKKQESRTGYLMGVYGPLYAIRKSCYREIPSHIILDDLYLSLKILREKKIVLVPSCRIVEDSFVRLYNLNRSKRYLKGLVQILTRTDLVGELPFKLRVMLLWHKYIRLFIPPAVVLVFIMIGFLSLVNSTACIVLACLTAGLLLSLAARRILLFSNINSLIRITLFYVISMVSLSVNRLTKL